MDMAGIRAFMARRIMGIPAGVFVLLGAAVILFFAIRMRNSAADAPAEDTTGDTPDSDGGENDSTQQPTFSASDVEMPVMTATPIVTQTATNDTNDAWKRRAIEYLMAQGYTVEVATNAISKYLNGEPLNTNESAARDSAVKQLGLPPEDIPDVLKTHPPKEKPDNTPAVAQGVPPLQHEVKGNRDNTARELAVLYYGTTDSDALEKIHSANTTKVEPYAVGTKVKIPERYQPKYFRATAHVHTVYDIARRNGKTPAQIEALNPGMNFPVKVGTRVRVK